MKFEVGSIIKITDIKLLYQYTNKISFNKSYIVMKTIYENNNVIDLVILDNNNNDFNVYPKECSLLNKRERPLP